MPRGMGKLNHLQHLDFFVVGKHEENGIKELGGLSNLRGQLEIRNLENVSQSDEALEARMMDKKHINSLQLEWSGCNNNSTNFQLEIDVLCKLQPHFNIESLVIEGYKGTRFPDWMGNSSYLNMKILGNTIDYKIKIAKQQATDCFLIFLVAVLLKNHFELD